MKKAISYSLFGFGKPQEKNCFSFHSYLRGLLINVRLNRLIYPEWDIILHVDQATFSAYEKLLTQIGVIVKVQPDAPLCLAMLWRMKPIFEKMPDQTWKYSHVICRDLDSPTTYREAQAVHHWIEHDKAAHAITDSISHTIPLMGGMIGFRPDYITERIGQTWEEMLSLAPDINYTRKGSDQDFLNRAIYPKVGEKGNDSITQHYILGHGDTFLSDWHNKIPDVYLGLDEALKESNHICGHIGASGHYEGELFRFLRPYWDQFQDLIKIEKSYPQIFYWNL